MKWLLRANSKLVKTNCPLCGKAVADQLIHLRLIHEIEDASQFADEMRKIESVKERQAEFAEYVQEQWGKKVKGLITAEDYRRLVSEWSKQHELGGTQ